MQVDLREKIKAATEESGITKPDFIALLKLINEHYDRMEATITQTVAHSLDTATQTPIEAIFDSVTDALLTVDTSGVIRTCNKVCSRYFGLGKAELSGLHVGQP